MCCQHREVRPEPLFHTTVRGHCPGLPRSSTMSLSMPRGPRVVRTASAMTWQALMLLTSWGMPCEVSVPSFRRITGVGCREKAQQSPYSQPQEPGVNPSHSPAQPKPTACTHSITGTHPGPPRWSEEHAQQHNSPSTQSQGEVVEVHNVSKDTCLTVNWAGES